MKKCAVNPCFFIILIWLLFCSGYMVALSYFFVILLHELGHYFIAKKLGYKLSRFSLSPYGVSLSYYGETLEEKDEVYIALAGPITNLLSAFLVIAVWWLFPSFYSISKEFTFVSFVIALFNLLPAYPLDGGRVFVACCGRFMARKKAIKITMILNVVLSVFFFLMFFVFCFINFNPTYLLFGVFLVMGLLDLKFLSRYEKLNVFNKNFKNFSKPRFFVISEDVTLKEILKKIEPNKTTIFVIITQNGKSFMVSDKQILNLAFKAEINSKIFDFMSKKEKK